jgi:hypothetical protein
LAATVALQETFAVPEPLVTLAGVIEPQVRPEGIVSFRTTVPVNPFSPPIVIVVFAEVPALTVAGGVVVVIVKSWNWNVTVAL